MDPEPNEKTEPTIPEELKTWQTKIEQQIQTLTESLTQPQPQESTDPDQTEIPIPKPPQDQEPEPQPEPEPKRKSLLQSLMDWL